MADREPDSVFPEDKPRKILGLVGSPRVLGNCELLIKEISNRIEVPHVLDLVRLPSLRILGCTACYGCIMDKHCPRRDHMSFLLDSIAHADAIIIASPVYFFGAHGIFKNILDRGFLFYDYIERTFGKPCLLASLYGMENRLGVAPHTLRSFAACLGLDVRASVALRAALPGDVLADGNQETISGLAKALLPDEGKDPSLSGGKAGDASGTGCPYCGNEIVRMEERTFTCALCHGTFSVDGEDRRIKIKEGGIFGSPGHMLLHKEWLKGMKERFLSSRREALKRQAPYKTLGNWVEPQD